MFISCVPVACAFLISLTHARLMFLELGESPAEYSKLLNNQNILMLGDSMMRYQYISLAHLLHTNSFVSPTERPNLLIHHSYKSPEDHYYATSAIFSPNEFTEVSWGNFENHYYRNKERNLSLIYMVYSGQQFPPKGGWQPTETERFPSYRKLVDINSTITWHCSNVEEVFSSIISKLDPRPTMLVLNAGHWKNDWHEPGREESVMNAALKNFDRVIWKTTNYNNEHQPGDFAHDSTCTYPGVECMHQDWTKYVSPERYTDRLHFTPEVFSDINMQFIYQIAKKQPLRAAPIDVSHIGQIIVHKDKHFLVDKEGLLRPFSLPQTEVNSTCHKDIAARKHVHKAWMVLITHILGEPITDICAFIAS